MKKIIAVFGIVLFAWFTILLPAQVVKKIGWQSQNLKGKVAEMVQIQYTFTRIYWGIGLEIDYKNISKYDRHGILVDFKSYNAKGTLRNIMVIKYINNGTEIYSSERQSDGSMQVTSISKLDVHGNVSEIDYNHDFGGVLNGKYKYINKYDTSGNLIEVDSYNPDGSRQEKKVFKNDNSASPIKVADRYYIEGERIEWDISSSDRLASKWGLKKDLPIDSGRKVKYIYKYDKKGNQIEVTELNTDNTPAAKTSDKYDANDNKLEEAKYTYDTKFGSIGETLIQYATTRYTYYD